MDKKRHFSKFKDSIKYLKKEEWDELRGSIDNYRDKLIITLAHDSRNRVIRILEIAIGS